MRFKKLKAGALQITIFVVVIVALLLSAFLVFVHTNSQFDKHTDFIIEAYRDLDKGINYSLLNNTILNDTIVVTTNTQDYKTIKTHRAFWGVFEKVTTTSKVKKTAAQKIVLMGSRLSNINRTALYLQDNNKPLVLVGQTKIQGLCYLPERGVKAGNISGESYYGEQLIYGNTKSSSTLPKLNPELLYNLKGMSNDQFNILSEQYFQLQDGQVLSNSFVKTLHVHYNPNAIDLINVKLTGNIVVRSSSKIVVHPSSKLTDVILIAPEIEIKENTKGVFQAIASKRIIVNKNCKLKYPSALALLETEESTNAKNQKNSIEVYEGSEISGSVLYIGNSIENNYQANVVIKPKALINGEVYCNKNIELEGMVNGSIYVNNFVVKKAGSIYQNHIYNGNITIDNLPEEFVGLTFINASKEIIKCLY